MFTSANHHYIQTEYLSPLPTKLDTKSSPLALLAQTCSQIGSDKPLVVSFEKTKHNDRSREKTSFKPFDSTVKTNRSDNGEKPLRTSNVPNAHESPEKIRTRGLFLRNGSRNSEERTVASPKSGTSTSTSPVTQNTVGCGGRSDNLYAVDPGSTKTVLGSIPNINPLSTYLPGGNPLVSCVECSHILEYVPTNTPSSAYTTQRSSTPVKPGVFSIGRGLSPYMGYTRVKIPGGGTTIIPLYQDPSCGSCQFGIQNVLLNQCRSNCGKYSHERQPKMELTGSVPGLFGSSLPTNVTSLYPNSLTPRPDVCSWIVGESFCGKRLNSPEELLQHLRTHPPSDGDNRLSSASYRFHCGSPITPTTQNGVRRSYPTNLSPVRNRFHPYTPSLPQVPYPELGLYYSPNTYYGQRLGPPVQF